MWLAGAVLGFGFWVLGFEGWNMVGYVWVLLKTQNSKLELALQEVGVEADELFGAVDGEDGVAIEVEES